MHVNNGHWCSSSLITACLREGDTERERDRDRDRDRETERQRDRERNNQRNLYEKKVARKE